jgi:hypothetical protein
MPKFLDKKRKQKQFTSEEAEASRLCTNVRWTVEAVHAQIKQWFRALDTTIQNKSLTHLRDDIQIAAAMVNRFRNRLVSDVGM